MKTISAYMNIALEEYDITVRDHVVELMKESLREQCIENIFEATWKVEENKRQLFKNEKGAWEADPLKEEDNLKVNDIREILEVMTITTSVMVES